MCRRDCTTSLKISPLNAKYYWMSVRMAMLRFGFGSCSSQRQASSVVSTSALNPGEDRIIRQHDSCPIRPCPFSIRSKGIFPVMTHMGLVDIVLYALHTLIAVGSVPLPPRSHRVVQCFYPDIKAAWISQLVREVAGDYI